MRQNDYVEYLDQKTKLLKRGIVLNVRAGMARVLLPDRQTVVSGPTTSFVRSSALLPDCFRPSIAKGEVVEFETENGTKKLGVVDRVSATQAVVICDAGRTEVRDFPWKFLRTNESIRCAIDEGPIAQYSVRSYRALSGHGDVQAFSATVLRDGRPFAYVLNDGWGSPSSCQPCRGVTLKDVRRFERAVSLWARTAGQADSLFALECWIEWFVKCRPYGMSAEDYMAD